jgi:flagellar protein FliJ
MKSLPTLIKVQKSVVDDYRRMLAELERVRERILAEIAELEQARAQEEHIAAEGSPLERTTLAAFLEKLRLRLEQLRQALKDADDAVVLARERLAEAFETQKRYEIVRDQQAEAAMSEAKRQEMLQLDETAAQRHERDKSSG